jgi:putative membrane protein
MGGHGSLRRRLGQQYGGEGAAMVDWGREVFLFLSSVAYAVLGGVLLLVAYKVFDWATPTDLGHEIFEKNNSAAAILAGGFLIALALIIAAAIH